MILMEEIISIAKELGYHAILSLIAANNEPSIALHNKLGFEHGGPPATSWLQVFTVARC